MKRVPLALATLLVGLTTLPSLANARPCCYGYRVRYYRAHPHYHVVRRAPSPPRWSLGLHGTGVSTDQMFDGEPVMLGGLGGHLRYRSYRWAAELALDAIGGEFVEGKIRRVSIPIQASALLYLIPEGTLNLYLIGGLRVQPTIIRWNYPTVQDEQEFAEFGLHGGIGADLNISPYFALTADLRFFGVMRADADAAGSYYSEAEPAVLPKDSTGLQFSFGGSFRF